MTEDQNLNLRYIRKLCLEIAVATPNSRIEEILRKATTLYDFVLQGPYGLGQDGEHDARTEHHTFPRT